MPCDGDHDDGTAHESSKHASTLNRSHEDYTTTASIAPLVARLQEGTTTDLECNYSRFSVETFQALTAALAQQPSITRFEAIGCGLTDADAPAIASLILHSAIVKLKLGGNKLTDVGLESISEAIRARPHQLVQLHLSNNPVTHRGIEALCGALASSQSIAILSLRDVDIGDAGYRGLFSLMATTNLRELHLRGSLISDAVSIHFGAALDGSRNSLEVLLLANLSLTEVGLATVCRGLMTCRKLSTLLFSGNSLAGELTRSMARVVSTTPLQSLFLTKCGMGVEGMKLLSAAVASHQTLTTLDVSGNALGDAGAEVLSETLRQSTSLVSLYASLNGIGYAGSTSLVSAIANHSTLRSVDVSSNFLSDAAAPLWADLVRTDKSLTRLVLTNNEMGSDGVQQVIMALHDNFTLKHLQLGGQSRTPPVRNAVTPMMQGIITDLLRRNAGDPILHKSQAPSGNQKTDNSVVGSVSERQPTRVEPQGNARMSQLKRSSQVHTVPYAAPNAMTHSVVFQPPQGYFQVPQMAMAPQQIFIHPAAALGFPQQPSMAQFHSGSHVTVAPPGTFSMFPVLQLGTQQMTMLPPVTIMQPTQQTPFWVYPQRQ